IAGALAVAGRCPAQGNDRPTSPAPRLDHHGDPLPAGAVARLGTRRLQFFRLIYDLALAPDHRTIATASANALDVRLHDARAGKALRSKPAEGGGAVCCLAFSPDSKRLAAGTYETARGRLLIWDAGTGQLLRQIRAHDGPVWHVTFGDQGKTLVS